MLNFTQKTGFASVTVKLLFHYMVLHNPLLHKMHSNMEYKHIKWLRSQIHNIQNKEVDVKEDSYELSSEGTH